MAPSKRPAKGTDAEPTKKKRVRPSKSDSVDENRVATEAAKKLVESNEPIDASDIDEVVGFIHEPPNENWTAEEESEVDRLWDESPEKEAWDRMSAKSHPFLLPLFKICLCVSRRNSWCSYRHYMMWHRQFLQAWEEWGVHEMPESKADWVEWATKLRTTRTTAIISRYALGKPKTEITWVTVAPVLANPRWTEESIRNGHGLEWAKRAQRKSDEVLSLSW